MRLTNEQGNTTIVLAAIKCGGRLQPFKSTDANGTLNHLNLHDLVGSQ